MRHGRTKARSASSRRPRARPEIQRRASPARRFSERVSFLKDIFSSHRITTPSCAISNRDGCGRMRPAGFVPMPRDFFRLARMSPKRFPRWRANTIQTSRACRSAIPTAGNGRMAAQEKAASASFRSRRVTTRSTVCSLRVIGRRMTVLRRFRRKGPRRPKGG